MFIPCLSWLYPLHMALHVVWSHWFIHLKTVYIHQMLCDIHVGTLSKVNAHLLSVLSTDPQFHIFNEMHCLAMNILSKPLIYIWNYCDIPQNVLWFIVLVPFSPTIFSLLCSFPIFTSKSGTLTQPLRPTHVLTSC